MVDEDYDEFDEPSYMEEDDDSEDSFYYEDPCKCWCEMCGCHGWCMDDDDDSDYSPEPYDYVDRD